MILRYPSAAGCHGGLEAHWGDGTGFGCVKLTVETEFQGLQKESRAVRKLLQWLTQEKTLAWGRMTAKTGLTDPTPHPSSSEPHGHTTRWGLGETRAYRLPRPTDSPGRQPHRAHQTRGRPA